MPVYLHAIETWNPSATITQTEAAQQICTQLNDKRSQRIARHLYKKSAIDTRHTCVPFASVPFEGPRDLFTPDPAGKWTNPLTGDRNKKFTQISKTASVELARKTLKAAPGFSAADITHVITASCTGSYTPGPDHHIVCELGLSHNVERFHLGFMGCYAAFPALRLANTLCKTHPDAVVLIQCLELCSLHLQLETNNPESLVASSLFADGAGGALVSARAPASGQPSYEIHQLASTLVPTGEKAMAWEIGNHGYEITLSSYVPEILGENIDKALLPHLDSLNWSLPEVDFWAVHPGGKAILDRITEALNLPPDALHIARDILRRYGNMSSATIFFLLKNGLTHIPANPFANPSANAPTAPPINDRTVAMAFGPGLTVEMAFLQRSLH